jgi:hypothetical protein
LFGKGQVNVVLERCQIVDSGFLIEFCIHSVVVAIDLMEDSMWNTAIEPPQLTSSLVEQVHALPRVSGDVRVVAPVRLEEDCILAS